VSLEGKVAIVTGAGRGLGRGVAQVFAERGASLVLTGRTPETLESIRDEIRVAGGAVEIVPGDVGVQADVQRAIDTAVDRFGGIDVLVNNAQSLSFDIPLLEMTDEQLEVPFRSGFYGTLYAMRAAYPHLKARGGGAIVNFGSSTALTGSPGFAPYAIAKESIRAISRVAANEWGPDGIRVNIVYPAGFTEGTKVYRDRDPEGFDLQVQRIPLRRVGDPVLDIGRAVAALAGDDLSYLTGASLMLDGGSMLIN
jgi:2-hydroxycyclohexanecarboxyl-CoA dehydrogenase